MLGSQNVNHVWKQHTYIYDLCSKLVTSDGYALTDEGKGALERISVSLQVYNDNTVTQKVWKTTREVGCGFVAGAVPDELGRGGGTDFLVCRYSPGAKLPRRHQAIYQSIALQSKLLLKIAIEHTVEPKAPTVAIPIAFSNPKLLVCAVNPISGNINSLGIGGNMVSNNAPKNAPGYPIYERYKEYASLDDH